MRNEEWGDWKKVWKKLEGEKGSMKVKRGMREWERKRMKKEECCKWLRHLVWSWHFENLVA